MTKRRVQWIITNGLFAALVGIGWYSNYSWASYAKNMVYFVSWVMFGLALLLTAFTTLITFAIANAKGKNQKELLVGVSLDPSVPLKLDLLYDLAIVMALAGSGSFVIASVYTLAQVGMQLSRHALLELRKKIIEKYPEVGEKMRQEEARKRPVTGTELDLN